MKSAILTENAEMATLQIPETLLDYTWDESEPHLKDEWFDKVYEDHNCYIQEALVKNVIVEKDGVEYKISPEVFVVDTYVQEEEPEGDEISEACQDAIISYLDQHGLGKYRFVTWEETAPLMRAGIEWWPCLCPDEEN